MPFLDKLIASTIGWVPRSVVRRVAARYVAGETLDDAMAAARRLAELGCCATFDLLGEFVETDAQADETADEYLNLLERIRADGLEGNVSVKLTAFGLLMDQDKCYRRLRRVVDRARELGKFVRIDMEDSPCTQGTLDLYRRLRSDGCDNVGVVLQAYLKRTLDDIAALEDLLPSYRLCKGIYVEPEEIAFKGREEIRRNYRAALAAMLDGGSYVGIATHDDVLVKDALGEVARRGLSKDAYEFQMLLGVTERLRARVVAAGHRLRVYIPYGRDWYGYCIRRLKENPEIGRHVFLGLFKRS